MGSVYFPYDIPTTFTTHIVFQMSTGFSGDIIKQINTNTTTNQYIKLSYNGTSFIYSNEITSSNVIISQITYKYYHLVITPTNGYLYGYNDMANPSTTPLKIFAINATSIMDGYDKVYLYGDNKFSYLWTLNKIQTSDEIALSLPYNFKPISTTNTICLAVFDNSLNAGDTRQLTSDLVNWNIYRKKKGDTNYQLAGQTLPDIKSIWDYAVAQNTYYDYQVQPITENEVGEIIQSTEKVMINSWSHAFVDIITMQVVLLDLDVETGEISIDEDRTEYQNQVIQLALKLCRQKH